MLLDALRVADAGECNSHLDADAQELVHSVAPCSWLCTCTQQQSHNGVIRATMKVYGRLAVRTSHIYYVHVGI